ncbi:hypothetical protein ACC719_37045, partial [Rhizobium ruizarguesonis]
MDVSDECHPMEHIGEFCVSCSLSRHAFKSIPVAATPGNHQFNQKARGFCSSMLESVLKIARA